MKQSVFLEAVAEKQSRDALAAFITEAERHDCVNLYVSVPADLDYGRPNRYIGVIPKKDLLEAVRVLVLASEMRLAELGIEEDNE